MTPSFDPDAPDAVVADALEEAATLVVAKYMRRAESASTQHEREHAEAEMAKVWRGKYRRGMDRSAMLTELRRLHELLDELEGHGDGR